jgi:hypothetical protein
MATNAREHPSGLEQFHRGEQREAHRHGEEGTPPNVALPRLPQDRHQDVDRASVPLGRARLDPETDREVQHHDQEQQRPEDVIPANAVPAKPDNGFGRFVGHARQAIGRRSSGEESG